MKTATCAFHFDLSELPLLTEIFLKTE